MIRRIGPHHRAEAGALGVGVPRGADRLLRRRSASTRPRDALLRCRSPTGTCCRPDVFVGLANYGRLCARPGLLEGLPQHLRLPAHRHADQPAAVVRRSPITSTRCASCTGFIRALYFMPFLTTAVAMAWVWRWFYQPPPIGAVQRRPRRPRPRRSSRSCARPPRRCRAVLAPGDLGRPRLPDRASSWPACAPFPRTYYEAARDRRRRPLDDPARDHAAAAAADHRLPGRHLARSASCASSTRSTT